MTRGPPMRPTSVESMPKCVSVCTSASPTRSAAVSSTLPVAFDRWSRLRSGRWYSPCSVAGRTSKSDGWSSGSGSECTSSGCGSCETTSGKSWTASTGGSCVAATTGFGAGAETSRRGRFRAAVRIACPGTNGAAPRRTRPRGAACRRPGRRRRGSSPPAEQAREAAAEEIAEQAAVAAAQRDDQAEGEDGEARAKRAHVDQRVARDHQAPTPTQPIGVKYAAAPSRPRTPSASLPPTMPPSQPP